MVTSSRPEPILQLQEYSITDAAGKVVQRAREEGLEIEIFTEGKRDVCDFFLSSGAQIKYIP